MTNKREIIITNSKELSTRWDGKTLNEIADEINPTEVLCEQRYFRNIIGDFFGLVILTHNNTEYHFIQSQTITHSINSLNDLGNCIGRYFKIEITTVSGDGLNEFNEGFIICKPNEFPSKIKSLNTKFIAKPEIPKEIQDTLIDKSLSQAFHGELFLSIAKENAQIIFQDIFHNRLFIIIDDYKVYLSKSLTTFTYEQLVSKLDDLVFHKGTSNLKNSSFGTAWFRLGLSNRVIQTRTEIDLNNWVFDKTVSYKEIPEHLQIQLNGMTLSESVSKGILHNDENLKILNVSSDKSNEEKIVLSTNQGCIELNELLVKEIENHVDRLGDLVFRYNINNKGKSILFLSSI